MAHGPGRRLGGGAVERRGVPSLAIHNATSILSQDNAVSADTSVTIDGGVLNYHGHADAIGNLTVINGGQVMATVINNATTIVQSGTLTAASIVCDTLVIGSFSGVAADGADQSAMPTTGAPQSIANDLPVLTIAAKEAIAADSGNSRSNAVQPQVDELEVKAILSAPTSTTLSTVRSPLMAPATPLVTSRTSTTTETNSVARLQDQRETPNSKRVIGEPVSKHLSAGIYANFYARTRSDDQHSFLTSSPLSKQFKESVYVELADFLPKPKRQTVSAFATNLRAHSLALFSIEKEIEHDLWQVGIAELLVEKHFYDKGKLPDLVVAGFQKNFE
jgi:hypothetical protein